MEYNKLSTKDIEAIDRFKEYVEQVYKYANEQEKVLNEKMGYKQNSDIELLFNAFIENYILYNIGNGGE